MFKKQVKCSECGFLGIAYDLEKSLEIDAQARSNIVKWFTTGRPVSVSCLRGQDYLIESTISDNVASRYHEFIKNIDDSRCCSYYYTYTPGYSPEQHLELQRDAKTRRTLILGMIIAAVIGAIIGALISKVVG